MIALETGIAEDPATSRAPSYLLPSREVTKCPPMVQKKAPQTAWVNIQPTLK